MPHELPGPRSRVPAIWIARPECLRCGLCCIDTEMILTPSDIARLEALGFKREYFTVRDGRLYRLRNVDGRCVFFRNGRCVVYEYRPIGCSMYPIVIDAESGKVTVDEACPLAHTTSDAELERAKRYARLILAELGLRGVKR